MKAEVDSLQTLAASFFEEATITTYRAWKLASRLNYPMGVITIRVKRASKLAGLPAAEIHRLFWPASERRTIINIISSSISMIIVLNLIVLKSE